MQLRDKFIILMTCFSTNIQATMVTNAFSDTSNNFLSEYVLFLYSVQVTVEKQCFNFTFSSHFEASVLNEYVATILSKVSFDTSSNRDYEYILFLDESQSLVENKGFKLRLFHGDSRGCTTGYDFGGLVYFES